jgi:membrane associated rhomboid family serine protease
MAKDMTLSGGTAAKPASKGEVLRQRAFVVGLGLALMWGLEVIDAILGQKLNSLGIEPRTLSGLIGIPLAPLLHGGFDHLLANTVPFAILAFLTIMRGLSTFIMVTLIVTLVGGALVWIMGSSGYHIGASGLIFGYFGYNLAMGIFERSFKSIAMAVLVGLLYGGMIFGVFPGRAGVSWEGHLFGALAGTGWAFLATRQDAAAKAKRKA